MVGSLEGRHPRLAGAEEHLRKLTPASVAPFCPRNLAKNLQMDEVLDDLKTDRATFFRMELTAVDVANPNDCRDIVPPEIDGSDKVGWDLRVNLERVYEIGCDPGG